MQKFKSKKGFTLAELLIVVAIIAVLTAIAVPLFVGSLNKAEENVKNANIRNVRSIAVVAILNATPDKSEDKTDTLFETTGALKNPILAQAYVTKTGDVKGLTFVQSGFSTDSCEKVDGTKDAADITKYSLKAGEDYKVQVVITPSDVTGEHTVNKTP